MDVKGPRIEIPTRPDVSTPSAPAERPTVQPRAPVNVFPDSAPKGGAIIAPPPATLNTAQESPGFWNRVKSFFGRSEAPRPTVIETAPKPEPLEEGWHDIGSSSEKSSQDKTSPGRSYKLPDSVKMDDVEKELESLSDEMFADEPTAEERTLAELEALPSPPKGVPQAATPSTSDLEARLNRLREGYTPASSEAQLSARLRDLTNSNIPSLEEGLSSVSTRRFNPQTATPEQIRSQSSQFMKTISTMSEQLKSYLKTGVSPKSKLDASSYAGRISDRIATESKSIGNSIIQIGQRKDLSQSQKDSLVSDLRSQINELKKMRTQVQQFRFDITGQVNAATRRGR